MAIVEGAGCCVPAGSSVQRAQIPQRSTPLVGTWSQRQFCLWHLGTAEELDSQLQPFWPGLGRLDGEMVPASMALPPSFLTRPCPRGSSSLVLGLAARLKLLHPLFISFCCHCCLAEAGLFTASLCCCRVGSI